MPLIVRLAGTHVEEGRADPGRERGRPDHRRPASPTRRRSRSPPPTHRSRLRRRRHDHPDRREHPRPRPGHHRQDRRLPHRGDDRLRHQRRRRRDAGQGRHQGHDRPVFDTVKDAVAATGATPRIVFVPPPYAADSIMEAADAGIRVCVAITDGIPAQDMIRVKRYMRRYKAESRMRLMGPNCAGVISPGRCLLGIMPGHIYLRGRDRRRRPLGHPGLRGRGADEGAGHRHLDQRRHRRRPDQRQLVQGRARAVRARTPTPTPS